MYVLSIDVSDLENLNFLFFVCPPSSTNGKYWNLSRTLNLDLSRYSHHPLSPHRNRYSHFQDFYFDDHFAGFKTLFVQEFIVKLTKRYKIYIHATTLLVMGAIASYFSASIRSDLFVSFLFSSYVSLNLEIDRTACSIYLLLKQANEDIDSKIYTIRIHDPQTALDEDAKRSCFEVNVRSLDSSDSTVHKSFSKLYRRERIV